MARRGRLSKGCQTCRKRKIKCDQLLPGCTQCRKSGWVCPQYGDTVDRMMQYQEPPTFITRPARKACAQLKAVKQATKLGILSDLVVPAMLCKSLPREITQSLNDRAISYFIHTHAFRDNGQVRGCYEYLLTLDIFVMEEPYTCLSAAALAAYGNACRRPDILREARRYYGRSLQLINSALQSRAKAAEISTMISILLLNSFEALTSDTMQTMGHSDGHMRGVLTIMSLRGPGLMESREGLQVFLHMCRCLITYCIMRPLQVPAEMIDLRKHAAKFLDIRNPAWVLEELMLKVATFRADVEAGVYDGQMTAIDHALELDNELYRLTGKMPAHWHFDAVIAHDSSRAPSGYYHVYPDFWVAYIWNYARTCRLFLHRMIQEQLIQHEAIDSSLRKSSNLRSQSLQTSQQLIGDICASVTQYCDDTHRWINSGENTGEVPTIAGGYFLLWPLMTAGYFTESTELRDWIIGRSRYIGQTTGIQRANTISQMLAQREHHSHVPAGQE